MNECIGVVGGADRAGLQLQSDGGQTKGSTSLFKKIEISPYRRTYHFFSKTLSRSFCHCNPSFIAPAAPPPQAGSDRRDQTTAVNIGGP